MTTPVEDDAQSATPLSFRDVVRFIRRHWLLLVVTPLVGVLLAALWATFQTPKYSSTTSALVSVGAGDNIGVALTADNLAKSKARQYAELGNSRAVGEAAIASLSYPLSLDQALEATDVQSNQDGALLTVSAEGDTPDHARELSAAWTSALADRVTAMETGAAQPNVTPGQGSSIIKVNVLSDADRPAAPSWPNIPLVLGLGAFLGLAIGAVYAFVRDVMDNKVRSAASIQKHYGLSVLGTIPQLSTSKGKNQGPTSRLMVDASQGQITRGHRDKSMFAVVESFKELRTNIEFLRPDAAPRVITITSAHPGEGKSSVAANLALTLALAEKPVVIIDADLRRPVMAKTFGLVEGVGITDVMVGKADVQDVMQFLPDLPSFAFVGAGRIPPNPSEILGSDRFRDMVEALAEKAFVIIDAPPLLPVTDAAILARRFDGCVLVVSAGRPTIEELGKAVNSVRNINADVLGVVLNRVPTRGAEASAYQYYGKAYYGVDESGSSAQ